MTMAKPTEDLVDDFDPELDAFDDLGPEDYVFVIRSDGSLKNVIFPPDVGFEYSKNLLKIFALFGVDNPDELLGDVTLH